MEGSQRFVSLLTKYTSVPLWSLWSLFTLLSRVHTEKVKAVKFCWNFSLGWHAYWLVHVHGDPVSKAVAIYRGKIILGLVIVWNYTLCKIPDSDEMSGTSVYLTVAPLTVVACVCVCVRQFSGGECTGPGEGAQSHSEQSLWEAGRLWQPPGQHRDGLDQSLCQSGPWE